MKKTTDTVEISKRKFYHTKIRLDVLTEAPIDEEAELADIVGGMVRGDLVGQWDFDNTGGEVTGKRAANLLHEFGSEPGFFLLDDAGRDVS